MLAFLDKIHFATPRIRRIIFWLLVSFTAYLLIGFLVLPPILQSVITTQATKELKRTTSIDDIDFNPLSMSFEIYGLKVAKKDGDGHLITVGSYHMAPSFASIWEFAPVVSYMQLRDMTLDITFFGDGKYSISDLIGASRPEKQKEDSKDEGYNVFPFALYGFEMTNARIIFDDRTHNKKHVIEDLDLIVPFTSSIMDMRKEFTQPKITAIVNGDRIELNGRTLPFDQSLRTEFQLEAVDIDLDQYWQYVPLQSPLHLVKGAFTSNISLFFERPNAQRINLFLGGGGTFSNLELSVPGDDTVLSLDALKFEMERFSLGDNELILNSLALNSPYFKVIRRENGDINWKEYFPTAVVEDKAEEAARPEPEVEQAPAETADLVTEQAEEQSTQQVANEASEQAVEQVPEQTVETDVVDPASPFRLTVKSMAVNEGTLDWQDNNVTGGFAKTYPHFSLQAENILFGGEGASSFNVGIGESGLLSVKGTATIDPLNVTANVELTQFDIPTYQPYIGEYFPMIVDSALLDVNSTINVEQGEALQIQVQNGKLTLSDLALRKPEADAPSITLANLSIAGVNVNVAEQQATVQEISLTSPSIDVVRTKSGAIDLLELMETLPKDTATPRPEQEQEQDDKELAWQASIQAFRINEGQTTFRDNTLKTPAKLSLDKINAAIDTISTQQEEPMKYDISARWGGSGTINVEGTARTDNFSSNGRLRLRNIGLRPLDNYVGEFADVLIAKGGASADLRYDYSGVDKNTVRVSGSAGLDQVKITGDWGKGELAGIEQLAIKGISFENNPNQLSIDSVSLNNPRASLSFNDKGRLNIRRALRIPEPAPVEATDAESAEDSEAAADSTAIEDHDDAEAPQGAASFFKTLKIAEVTMNNGVVSFEDDSVSPRYSTTLSQMEMQLKGASQDPEARPELDFKAKLGPTPLTVDGVVNPIITPIYSDLKITLTGLEMVPLTPYTIQSLAYPVEKGRLYADVSFKTEDWVLSANNRFFVEQLVLGPKDKRPDAPNVPVKFGLALLQDGNGDMQLNLPISGRLDDPNFRIGGIVLRAIVSLFVKALASPFSIIGSIFGGGEDMDYVVFEPGSTQIAGQSIEKINTIIKALTDRPKLTLEVDGVIDPRADKKALENMIFNAKLKQQKYDSLSRKERSETTMEAMTIESEEYAELLYEAYKDEPDPEDVRPTTLFVVDEQPVDVMEAFIRERIQVTDEDLKELERKRARAVKEYILSNDPSLTERVYLLDRTGSKVDKPGTPMHRADLGVK
ncbi:MAG: hypothetical protein CL942_01410 [Desulfovibrio sp.]|nr:hypothetical protein [Desulfovibrio sp.]|tara:strand:- start:21661 stop:25461 length:3801 start_codon:yes stop_codon:yes gene_type:complete